MLSILAFGCATWFLTAPQMVVATNEEASLQVAAAKGPAYPVRISLQSSHYTGRNLDFPDYPLRFSFLADKLPTVKTEAADGTEKTARDTTQDDPATSVGTGGAALSSLSTSPQSRITFASAFADLMPKRQPDKTSFSIGGISLLASDFNLAKTDSLGSALEVTKAVHANGAPKGRVALRIMNDTTILIDSEVLAGLLGDDPAKAKVTSLARKSSAGRFVEFDTLRSAGIDVRYDPVRDIVVLSSRQS